MRIFALILVIAVSFVSSSAFAATLNVVGGQLMGASDVLVDGNLYDVQFLDGTCIDLYNGCDDVSDFTFQTQADAALASQALLDQVFLDVAAGAFDSDPDLTNGCSTFGICDSITPWGLEEPFPNTFKALTSSAYNGGGVQNSVVENIPFYTYTDLSWFGDYSYAVWQPIPEPSTALLLGLGLTGLAGKGRRRGRSFTQRKGFGTRKLVLVAALVLMAGGAQAATLNVVGGQLMGASGVLVDGNLYDVQFLDGTCIDLYNGCDEDSDFTFQTEASAVLASQALLDQVFLDDPITQSSFFLAFDIRPELTNGCTDDYACSARTPWSSPGSAHPTYVYFSKALNTKPGICGFGCEGDQVVNFDGELPGEEYYLYSTNNVYAVWSVSIVPEPSTALLMGLGLTGLAAKGRRRNRS